VSLGSISFSPTFPAFDSATATPRTADATANRGANPPGQVGQEVLPGQVGQVGQEKRDGQTERSGVAPADRRQVIRDVARSGNQDPTARPPEEQAEIRELQRRDQEVRRHEAAHMAAGGALVRGGASYSYSAGPDGKRYAVGGEVSIDVSPVSGDPAATAAKMQRVRRAALAPAQPSGQDLSVAARAAQVEASSRMEATAQVRAGQVAGGSEETPEARGSEKEPSERTASARPASRTPHSHPVGSLVDAYA